MTKEGLMRLAKARHRLERKSQERHFSDESVLNMKRGYEIKCEQYESKIKELEVQIEKMKCCFTCEYQNKFVEAECGKCDNYNKWKLKELRR